MILLEYIFSPLMDMSVITYLAVWQVTALCFLTYLYVFSKALKGLTYLDHVIASYTLGFFWFIAIPIVIIYTFFMSFKYCLDKLKASIK